MEPEAKSGFRPSDDRNRWFAIAGLAVAYYAAGRLGQMLAIPPGNVTAVWPPSGLAFGALFLLGSGVWPGVWLGSLAANLWDYSASGAGPGSAPVSDAVRVLVAAGIATGSTFQALIGVRLIRKATEGRNPLDRVVDVLAFVGVAVVACLIAPSAGVVSLCAGGFLPWGEYGPAWITWWLGDLGGVLIVAPVLLAWVRPPRIAWEPRRAGEALLLAVSGFYVAQIVFGETPTDAYGSHARAYLILPFLVWAAFRFAQPGAATAVLAATAVAVANTVGGAGPFAAATLNDSLLRLQEFLATAAPTALILGAAVAERRRAEAALRGAYDDAESRVRARTEDLAEANEGLRHEIDVRRRAEEELGDLYHRAPCGFQSLDPQGVIIRINDTQLSWLGYGREEVLGRMNFEDLLTEEGRRQFRDEFPRFKERGWLRDLEYDLIRKDGTRLPVVLSATAVKDAAGRFVMSRSFLFDNTRRRLAEQALRESEERFRSLVQAIPDIIYKIDPDGRFTFVNESIRWYGYEPEALIGKHFSTILHPEDVSAVSRSSVLPAYAGRRTGDASAPRLFDERRTGERGTRNLEVRLLCRGRGEVRFGSLFSRGEVYATGQYGEETPEGGRRFLGTVGIIRDVTERRKAEDELRKAHDELEARVRERTGELTTVNADLRREIDERRFVEAALRESEERHRIVTEAASDGILTADEEGVIRYANPAAAEIFGHSPESLPGRPLEDLIPDRRRGVFAAGPGAPPEPGRPEIPGRPVELQGVHRSGREVPIEVTFGEFVKGSKRFRVGVLRDISIRRRNELLKNEFVATVSHELRTPLTAIHGSLGLIAGGLAGELTPKTRALVDTARRNSDRLVRLVNDILDVERLELGQTTIRPRTVDLVNLVKQSIEVNRPFGAKFGVRFDFRHDGGGVRVSADADRLMQVMTNLLSNAAKFSPPDGTVSVRVERTDGDSVRVTVADRGPGVPEELRGRIFQKFVQGASGSGARTGSGLGLSIAKSIIERHGGRIGYDSPPGGGTTFHFELPCARAREGVPA